MSSDSSDNAEAENLSDAESDTSDFSDNGETESKTTGTKRSRKFRQMPKEYDSTDSSDQEEIAVKKRSRKRPKIKDLTDKGSEGSTSSDHEPIFDEREDSNHDETNPITTQQRRNDSIIQRRLRENNRLNRNDSCENIDDLTRDGDNGDSDDIQSLLATIEGMIVYFVYVHQRTCRLDHSSPSINCTTQVRKAFSVHTDVLER